MKRAFIFYVALSIPLVLLTAPGARAKEKKSGVILSTVDIVYEYEVLGLVYYRSSELSPEKIHTELKKQAGKMDADYVIGIQYFRNAGYLYGLGTAVRLIEEEPER